MTTPIEARTRPLWIVLAGGLVAGGIGYVAGLYVSLSVFLPEGTSASYGTPPLVGAGFLGGATAASIAGLRGLAVVSVASAAAAAGLLGFVVAPLGIDVAIATAVVIVMGASIVAWWLGR